MGAVALLALAGAAPCQEAAADAGPPVAKGAVAARLAVSGRMLSAPWRARPKKAAIGVGAAAGARGLRVLGDEELRGVSAKGYATTGFRQIRPLPIYSGQPGQPDMGGLRDLEALLNPVLGGLNADIQVKDVLYAPGGALPQANRDGSVNLMLPQSVGEIDFQNIHAGSAEGGNFGSVRINSIDMGHSTITVSPK